MKRTLSVLTLGLSALLLTAALAGAATAPAAATTSDAKTTHMAAAPKVVTPAVDLNAASKEDLMKLPGIGEAIADRIIAGRPWASKSQLMAKNVVNKATYSKLKGMVVAKQAAK